jgi:hypothetical protein
MKKPIHYIDNKEFYAKISEYRKAVIEAQQENKELPRITEYLGKCFLMIAKNLAKRPNFANYSYRDEMISDGIENCILYINNFDSEKYNNPFAYFTQIIYFAFLRRIHRERKQLYIKHKSFESAMINEEMYDKFDDSDTYGNSNYVIDTDKMNEFVASFESKMKKKEKKPEALEKFFENEVVDESSVNN